jgi:aminopeptidase N
VIPSNWDAVSNEFVDPSAAARSEQAIQTIKAACAVFSQDISSYGELKVLPFKESYKISTYLYAICAGPYQYHERNSEGLPPMRIYARKSIIGECDFEEMFTVT